MRLHYICNIFSSLTYFSRSQRSKLKKRRTLARFVAIEPRMFKLRGSMHMGAPPGVRISARSDHPLRRNNNLCVSVCYSEALVTLGSVAECSPRVREVPGSNPGRTNLNFFFFFSFFFFLLPYYNICFSLFHLFFSILTLCAGLPC